MNKPLLTVIFSLGVIGGIVNAVFSADCTGEAVAWISSTCFAVCSLLLLYAPTK